MFFITGNRGFQLHFINEYAVSVQFGYGNYCRNYYNPEYNYGNTKSIVRCENAEVAIWKKGNKRDFVTGEILEKMGLDLFNDGEVCGNVTPEDVAKIINYVSTLEK